MPTNQSPLYFLFDMDGTLIDSNPTHKEAYTQFFARYDIELTDDDFKEHISGKMNPEIMPYFFEQKGEKLDDKRLQELTTEKETLYQQLMAPKLVPVAGLTDFLQAVQQAGIPMALATSAPMMNVDFVLDGLHIRQFFQEIVTDADVEKGKPEPDVFQVAAQRLGARPDQCVVFEDSAKGVESAQKAKMKVVALSISHEPEATDKADLAIDDYVGLTVEKISGE
ncbi:HAD family hydrolase [Fibrella aquatilis]|uniref:Beta-phosphoglucomutase n=1 Tax=Fibrella aquatilis TaxID=2817059 RepID=A0A939G5A2_9BACT|nr:HAD family phosphatase [Fibrella aquatilis]MBO0930276.1 HAD family phosphatase [Fibrella aquatilis]